MVYKIKLRLFMRTTYEKLTQINIKKNDNLYSERDYE